VRVVGTLVGGMEVDFTGRSQLVDLVLVSGRLKISVD
jgi:hypothetical protein